MSEVIKKTLDQFWPPNAYVKYGWEKGVNGICIEYSLLTIAQMAEKSLVFAVKRHSREYLIDPNYAKYVVKESDSVFTRRKDRKVFAVIPTDKCKVLE